MSQIDCPVCESPHCEIISEGINPHYECEVCGTFSVSGSAAAGVLNADGNQLGPIQRAVLSHRIREANDGGREPPLLTTHEVNEVINDGRLPTPAQQAINILRFLGDRVAASGRPVQSLPLHFPATVGSPNRNFAMRIARELRNHGLLSALDSGTYESPDEIMEVDLTLSGWSEYEKEQRGEASGGYGFIALKFGDPVLDPFVGNVIKPAVAALGYELVDMRDAAEAGIIDNVMRARIRDASFVLVDLTHANEGAYWEAGYAEGLGKPVLYLCNRHVFEEQGTHFDTNHCTTVLWDTAAPDPFTEELKATLRRSLGLFAF